MKQHTHTATAAGEYNLAAGKVLTGPAQLITVMAIKDKFLQQLYPGRGELGVPEELGKNEVIVGATIGGGDLLIRDMATERVRLAWSINIWLGLGNPQTGESMDARNEWVDGMRPIFTD